MQRGIATFTLDHGHCPPYLFERMVKLGREITRVLVDEFGPDEFVERLADPVWFQSLGTVLAFDWNASGLTTVLLGALKESIRGDEQSLGVFICGGKGKTSRKTPDQIKVWGERLGLPASQVENFEYNSKMSAKVDSALVQDDYQLYHHNFIFSRRGGWTVVQQGMNQASKTARRYHWHSSNIKDLIIEPHSGIASQAKGRRVLNLTAIQSGFNRDLSLELLSGGHKALIKDIKLLAKYSNDKSQMVSFGLKNDKLTLLQLRRGEFEHHKVELESFEKSKYLQKIMARLSDEVPENYEKLLATEGVGAKTVRALSLVGELIYGAKPSYQDPARYSFAHGGKDATPYPVDRATYDKTIEIMKRAVRKAKIDATYKSRLLQEL